jgi:hypothetical protein
MSPPGTTLFNVQVLDLEFLIGGFYMDWIEKLFGINLDGGDGSAETMVILACVVVLAVVVAARVPLFHQPITAKYRIGGCR